MKPSTAAGFANNGHRQAPGRYSVVSRRIALPLVRSAIASAFLFLAACSGNAPDKEPVVTVQAAPVQKTTIQRTVTAEAILFPLQQAAITPKISAPVRTFQVKRGAKVHKGQLLAVLENRDLAAAAQENKGTYEQAEAAYTSTTAAGLPEEIQKAKLDTQAAKQALDAAEKVYKSREVLFQQGALPRRQLDEAGVSLTQARNAYDLAQRHLDSLMAVGKQQTLKSAHGQLESAQGKYQGAEAQLSYSEIRSPIDGVVTDRPLYPGEMAAAGTPLITVMDISQVIARAHIPQDRAALLKVGDKATITIPGVEKPVDGRVTIVSPALDPNSTTVEIWVQAKNPEQHMKPGASVQVSMLSQTVPDALVVPPSAILTAADGGTSVMVVGSDNRAHQKAVKTGIKQGDEIQIVDGVSEGEKVIASGAYGLPDNTKVTIEPGKESSQPEKSPGKENAKDEN